MLLNAKAEELSKYSKLKYEADKFIRKVKECWEYSGLQIRCVYLISDLAKKGNGVFSIAYSTFQAIFEERFNMEISLSSVRRFFQLMEKLKLLSINEAKRKNNSQSANIYIIEQQYEELQQIEVDEHPPEYAGEDLNSISTEIQNDKHKPLSKECVNKENVQQEQIIHNAYLKFKNHINKTLFFKILAEVKNKKGIRNFKAYLEGALSKVRNHIQYNNGTKVFKNLHLQDFYAILNS